MCFRPADVNMNSPVRCPVCGKINRPDAAKCIKCGATAEEMASIATDSDPTAPKAPPLYPGEVPPKPPAI